MRLFAAHRFMFLILENCQVEKPSWHVQPTTSEKTERGRVLIALFSLQR